MQLSRQQSNLRYFSDMQKIEFILNKLSSQIFASVFKDFIYWASSQRKHDIDPQWPR